MHRITEFIDSAKRDDRYDQASRFTWNLSRGLSNVEKVTLDLVGLYNVEYQVNERNNKSNIHYMEGVYPRADDFEITPGYYNVEELAAELQSTLRDVTEDGDLTVQVTQGDKLRFTATDPIMFHSNHSAPGFGELLGLKEGTVGFNDTIGDDDYNSDNFTGEYVAQPRQTRYYKIHIRELSTYGQERGFTVMNDQREGYQVVGPHTRPLYELDTQVSRLNRLTIEIRNEWDELLDLKGTNWTMQLSLYTNEL